MARKLIRITDTEALHAEGIKFPSTGALRWFESKAEENGFADAFVRVGRRVFVDPDRYHDIARAKGGQHTSVPRTLGEAPILRAAALAARFNMRVWRDGEGGIVKAARIGRASQVLFEFPDWSDAVEHFESMIAPPRGAEAQAASTV